MTEYEKKKEAAKSASILDIARLTGYTLVKRGSYYSFKEHDSVVIDTRKNVFYHNSQHESGDTISLLCHFNNMTFNDALNTILNHIGYEGYDDAKYKRNIRNNKRRFYSRSETENSFVLPKIAVNIQGEVCTDKIERFLIDVRKISPNVVNDFIENKRLYQQSIRQEHFKRGLFRSCCCFVGYPTGKSNCTPNFCERRTITPEQGKKKTLTVPASDWKHGFYINNGKKTLVVTEGILDSMAIMTILDQKGLDFKCYDYLSLIGTNKTDCLKTIIKEQPRIKEVIICLDNDEGGIASLEATISLLNEYFPHIKYIIKFPKDGYKDFNDFIMGKKKQ